MVVQQMLLPFEEGGRGRGGERSSLARLAVRQARAASTEAQTTSSSLLAEVAREETLARAWRSVRANQGARESTA